MSEVWKTYTAEELEAQVSAKRWPATRNEGKDVLQEFSVFCTNATEACRAKLKCTLNIPYGTKPAQKLDVYGTDLPAGAPTLFWIHGGYWQNLSKDMAGSFAESVVAAGVRLIAVGYTLAPEGTIKEMQLEVKQGLEKAMDLFPKGKFVLGGHSAGAHLATQLLYDQSLPAHMASRIEGMFLVSGVFDLVPLSNTYVNEPLHLTTEEATELSPLRNNQFTSSLKHVKLILLYGCKESMEFKRQSIMYHEQLLKAQFQADLIVSEEDDHFTSIEDLGHEGTVAWGTLKSFLVSFI